MSCISLPSITTHSSHPQQLISLLSITKHFSQPRQRQHVDLWYRRCSVGLCGEQEEAKALAIQLELERRQKAGETYELLARTATELESLELSDDVSFL